MFFSSENKIKRFIHNFNNNNNEKLVYPVRFAEKKTVDLSEGFCYKIMYRRSYITPQVNTFLYLLIYRYINPMVYAGFFNGGVSVRSHCDDINFSDVTAIIMP